MTNNYIERIYRKWAKTHKPTWETDNLIGDIMGWPKKPVILSEADPSVLLMEKLHTIEMAKTIYDIHYCRAGVGFLFYDPPKDYKRKAPELGKPLDDSWRQYLTVDTYYPTFEEAVNAEYGRLSNKK